MRSALSQLFRSRVLVANFPEAGLNSVRIVSLVTSQWTQGVWVACHALQAANAPRRIKRPRNVGWERSVLGGTRRALSVLTDFTRPRIRAAAFRARPASFACRSSCRKCALGASFPKVGREIVPSVLQGSTHCREPRYAACARPVPIALENAMRSPAGRSLASKAHSRMREPAPVPLAHPGLIREATRVPALHALRGIFAGQGLAPCRALAGHFAWSIALGAVPARPEHSVLRKAKVLARHARRASFTMICL